MAIYNVHIYREMRLTFGGIDAESHEAAASIARDRPTDQADSIDDCGGETFYACVDVQGDEDYEQSRWIDFEPEHQRQATPKLLAALKEIRLALAHHRHWAGTMPDYLITVVDHAIAEVETVYQSDEPATD